MPKVDTGYYAVRVGRSSGIYYSWDECRRQIDRFPNAEYKKFLVKSEAQEYLNTYKKKKIEREEALKAEKIIIYVDGSCTSDKKLDLQAGIGIYFKDKEIRVSEKLPGKEQTNNRAELYAVLRALELCNDNVSTLEIRSDSEYVINIFERWIEGWKKRNWEKRKGEIKNKDLIKKIDKLICDRVGKVFFIHVRAHQGEEGNETADKLAKKGALFEPVSDDEKLVSYFKK